jgi:hypothetical protein
VTVLEEAFTVVPSRVYTHHERYRETVHRSQPESIRPELAPLQVRAGHRVLEIGTGSGYSGALLAQLCGPSGRVTSVDISEELVRRAAAIHAERGVTALDCHFGDGLAGLASAGTRTAVDDALTVLGRWVDWCDHQPDPSWIALGWRADDDHRHTGARSALNQLLHPGYTETYDRAPMDWRSWYTFAAALDDPQLSLTCLRNQVRGIGHTTATSAAVILSDATVIADKPHSPSLTILRGWLASWERAGRPADSVTTALVPRRGGDLPGWDLRAFH